MTETADIILAEGDEARKEAEKKAPARSKTNYVKLKDGEQLRGFLLATKFVMYVQHGDFDKKITSHPCTDPVNGVNCLSCQQDVKKVKVTIIPFYNVDTKQIEIFDAKKRYVSAIYSLIDDYGEDSVATPISFKRSGADQSTTYTLTPLAPKTVSANKDLFVVPDEVKALQTVVDGKVTLSRDFYASVLTPPSEEWQREILGLTAKTPIDDDDSGKLPPVDGTDGF